MTVTALHHVPGVHAPLEVVDGKLQYMLYGQDGEPVRMECENTPSARMFVVWVRRHDRYTPRSMGEEQ